MREAMMGNLASLTKASLLGLEATRVCAMDGVGAEL